MASSLNKVVKLWPDMADGSTAILQLDILYVVLFIMTAAHAIRTRKSVLSGSMIVLYLLFHTIVFEHLSLFLGGTHCHATSTYLPMITPCSSINSVLFYIPWTYTSFEASLRFIKQHSRVNKYFNMFVFPFVMGLLQFGFGTVYEMQGPINNFWKWPDENGIIAENLSSDWYGYNPPFLNLDDSLKQSNEVATIDNKGYFRVSKHAGDALEQRLFGFPIFAPYFHFAFGFAWATGIILRQQKEARLIGDESNIGITRPSLRQTIFGGLMSTILFLPPIWITRSLSDTLEWPYIYGVPLSLGLSFIPIIMFLLLNNKNTEQIKASSASSSDPLLFGISLIMHTFMVSFLSRRKINNAEIIPNGLLILIASISLVHLSTQYYCCFVCCNNNKEEKTKKA